MSHSIIGYLLTALLLTAAIPLTGYLMEGGIMFFYHLIGRLFGSHMAYFLFCRLMFVGTIHHELSHALLATLTGAKVTKIVVFQPREDKLGYITYYTRGPWILKSIQNTLTGIAPVICGMGSLTLLLYYWNTHRVAMHVWGIALVWYLILSIGAHMRMSLSDFWSMWAGLPVIYLMILLICMVCHFTITDLAAALSLPGAVFF